jgi:hypothetical protein
MGKMLPRPDPFHFLEGSACRFAVGALASAWGGSAAAGVIPVSANALETLSARRISRRVGPMLADASHFAALLLMMTSDKTRTLPSAGSTRMRFLAFAWLFLPGKRIVSQLNDLVSYVVIKFEAGFPSVFGRGCRAE